MYKTILAGLWAALLALPVMADLQVQSFEAGLFKTVDVTLAEHERLLGAGTEEIIETRQIPATLGTKFGIRFTLVGKNHAGGNQVKYFYLTPGVVEPNGIRRDKYEVVQALSATAPHHMIAFQFTEGYEVVPGEWQLMVFEGDRLLLKESFAVGIDEQQLSTPPAEKPKTLQSVIKVER